MHKHTNTNCTNTHTHTHTLELTQNSVIGDVFTDGQASHGALPSAGVIVDGQDSVTAAERQDSV